MPPLPENPTPPPAADEPMLELRSLYRRFGPTVAVDRVSFQVRRAEVFGYIGPNGAGKTTSMRILATLDLPDDGDALVDGFSVLTDADLVRQRLGFMPDYFGTYANVNVREYLDFYARAYCIRQPERADTLERVMAFTGLNVLADKPTDGLSKGMKQRLCLGRALIHDPAVLVLDEPAAGLDPRARIELRRMIRQLADQGKTVLISSHILSELGEICDRVGIIEQGRLIAVGSVDEIQQQFRAAERAVEVRLLGSADPLKEWLRQRDGFASVQASGDTVRFFHRGELDAEVGLLREIVGAGFPVVAFGSRRESLEDVFMRVTEGRVQ